MREKDLKLKHDIPELSEIENFIAESGSDHVPTFGGKFEGGIQCQQIADELAPCIMAILESGEPVKSYLEIGVAAGGTTFIFNHFFKLNTIALIDDNRHPKAHVRPYILRDIIRNEIIGHSHADGTVAALKDIKTDFDIVLIDGDHTYAGVSKDVDIYRRFLREGGFLILHDSALPEWGIQQMVVELKKDKTLDFIGEYITQKHSRPCGVALFKVLKKEVINEEDI
jgi:predicted O-methyltransferase YrrM